MVSDQATEIDGQLVAKGENVVVQPGSAVRLAEGAMMVTFMAEADPAPRPPINEPEPTPGPAGKALA
jgi:hypothetical protein